MADLISFIIGLIMLSLREINGHRVVRLDRILIKNMKQIILFIGNVGYRFGVVETMSTV